MKSFKLIKAAIILQALYAFLPILRVSPDIIRIALRMTPFLLVTLGVFISKDKKLRGVYLIVNGFALLIGFLRSMVYANGIGPSILMNCATSMLYWITVVEGVYLLSHCSYQQASKILKVAAILVAITCFTSILGSIAFPGAIRESSDFSEEEFAYYWFNMGTYSFIYAITFFMPICLFYIKNKSVLLFSRSQNKILVRVLLVEIFMAIFFSQFMTALIIALVGVFCFLCSSKSFKAYRKKFFRLSIGGIAFLIVLAPIVNLMASLLEGWGLEGLHERFMGVYQVLTGGFLAAEGDVGARVFLYGLSLQHFLVNPVFGLWGELGFSRAPQFSADELLNTSYATQCVGQHSDIIDLLGGNGLFGFILFFAFIIWFWKNAKKYATSESALTFMHAALVMFVVYGVFDASLACLDVALTLFVLVPIVLLANKTDQLVTN